jgi:hypothetical protein
MGRCSTENYETNPNEQGASVVGQAVSSANFQATNRKLRNEPKEQRASGVEQVVSPANARSEQKLRNEPKASNHPLIQSSSLGKICEDR